MEIGIRAFGIGDPDSKGEDESGENYSVSAGSPAFAKI
jgi:hypothetical protein